MVTMVEQNLPAVPVLRLVTGSSAAETQVSGARAGRGSVELVLPDMPTVSREHATFTFSDGRWWITNQGRTGLPSTAPLYRVSSRSVMAMRSAGEPGPMRCRPALRSADARRCDNCHPRHGKTGWPRQWRAIVRE